MSEEKNINQEDRFDDLYRQSLGPLRVEPSARVWNRMNRQLLWRELLRFNFSNLPGYSWVIAAAVAVVIGTGIYWLSTGEPDVSVTPPDGAAIQAPAPAQPVPESPDVIFPSSGTSPVQTTPVADSRTPGTETPPSPPPLPLAPAQAAAAGPVAGPPSVSISPARAQAVEHEWLVTMESIPAEVYMVYGPTVPSVLTKVANPEPPSNNPEPVKTVQGSPLAQSLNVGLNITPDIVFYKNTSSYFKYDYTFDAGLQYNLGRFYLQSGAGIVWSTDIGTYAISANKNDSIGYYYSVIAFAENSSTPGQMEYTTTMNTVFDTNQYLYDYSSRNTYTYLEIPLAVGFKAVSKPRWSLGIEAGGFWSCMLQSDEPPPVFYIPEGRVTDIENLTPARRKNSFGLTGSVRLEYIFAKQFSLLIAPTFKYHLNAIEENDIPGATQPWSFGLRAGIWYRIELKK
jgi:hypothetical protein